MTSETIRQLKQLQQRKRITLSELWDEEKNAFVSDEDEMAETIKAARRRLEHTQYQPQEQDDGEAEPEPDKELLEGCGADFSKCRTRLERREVEIIILDQKAGKSPGPDGVRGELLKRQAYPLSKIFCEAWEEMCEGKWTTEMEEVMLVLLLRKPRFPQVPNFPQPTVCAFAPHTAIHKLKQKQNQNEEKHKKGRMKMRRKMKK